MQQIRREWSQQIKTKFRKRYLRLAKDLHITRKNRRELKKLRNEVKKSLREPSD